MGGGVEASVTRRAKVHLSTRIHQAPARSRPHNRYTTIPPSKEGEHFARCDTASALCFHCFCVAKTPPLPCVPTAFVAKTLPLPCVSTAFVSKTLPFRAAFRFYFAKQLARRRMVVVVTRPRMSIKGALPLAASIAMSSS